MIHEVKIDKTNSCTSRQMTLQIVDLDEARSLQDQRNTAILANFFFYFLVQLADEMQFVIRYLRNK
jgi:hypothetical protein